MPPRVPPVEVEHRHDATPSSWSFEVATHEVNPPFVLLLRLQAGSGRKYVPYRGSCSLGVGDVSAAAGRCCDREGSPSGRSFVDAQLAKARHAGRAAIQRHRARKGEWSVTTLLRPSRPRDKCLAGTLEPSAAKNSTDASGVVATSSGRGLSQGRRALGGFLPCQSRWQHREAPSQACALGTRLPARASRPRSETHPSRHFLLLRRPCTRKPALRYSRFKFVPVRRARAPG
jgi:hypothetical protein